MKELIECAIIAKFLGWEDDHWFSCHQSHQRVYISEIHEICLNAIFEETEHNIRIVSREVYEMELS